MGDGWKRELCLIKNQNVLCKTDTCTLRKQVLARTWDARSPTAPQPLTQLCRVKKPASVFIFLQMSDSYVCGGGRHDVYGLSN